MNYFVYVEGILGVRTNAKSFEWSYGTVAPLSDKEHFGKCKIRLYLDIKEDDEVFSKKRMQNVEGKFHYFSGNQDENKIYYERNYFFGKRLRYSIQVTENAIHAVVGKTYYNHVHHRIMNLHSMAYILTDFVSGMLLNNGIATIHCSAVNYEDPHKSIILFAPPNTGKTLTSMRLCKDHDANFVAEDFAMTDGTHVWAVPWTSTFRLYDDISESRADKVVNRLTEVIPVLQLVKLTKNKSIDSFIGTERMKLYSEATDVVVLERGKPFIDQDKSDSLRKLLTLNRYEFNYHKAPAMVVMSYFNPKFSLENMYTNEREILQKLLDHCEYTCINEESAVNYSETVYNHLIKES